MWVKLSPCFTPPPLFFSFENILTNEEQRTEYKNRLGSS